MAYGQKYELQFKDFYGVTWNAYIYVKDYSGSSSYLTGQGDPLNIVYEVTEHFTHTPIKPSYCEVNLIEFTDDTFFEFFTKDRNAKIKIYKNSVLYWQGWSIGDGYYSLYNLCPKPVKITFVDGLTFLKNIPLPVDDMGGPDKYVIREYFKAAFDLIGLENKCYEKFNITYAGLDLLTKFYVDTWRWYNEGTYSNMYEVLSDILFTFGARLYQHNGDWKIDNIVDLSLGSITYNRYSSNFTLEGTTEEDKVVNGLTPVNHSLYKELERPYSKFTLKVDYGLNTNVIRYKNVFESSCLFNFSEDNILRLTSDIPVPYLQGIKYYLGYFKFEWFNDKAFTVHLSAQVIGLFKVYLLLDNVLDDKTYAYNKVKVEGLAPDADSWEEVSDVSLLYWVNHSKSTTFQRVDETIDVYKRQVLEGNLYLLFCPPYQINLVTNPDWSKDTKAIIDMNQTTVTYHECQKKEHKVEFGNSDLNTNENELSIKLYSNPDIMFRINLNPNNANWDNLYQSVLGYINPGAVYPGCVFTDADQDMIYDVLRWIRHGESDLMMIEDHLVNQIMTYYAHLRTKCVGTIIGAMSFGNTIKYDNKIYMIAHINTNVKKQLNEVTLFEIGQYGSFLIDENEDYILLEDGNKIAL